MSEPGARVIEVEPLLAEAWASSAFREACRKAAEAGAILARLRRTREALGPRAVPMDRLVQDLAAAAGHSTGSVTAPFGLRLDGPPDPDSSRAWGRLAEGLGLTWREARLHLRLSVLEHAGAEPYLPVAARAADEADDMGDAEAHAEDQADHLTAADRELLRACEASALDGFAR